MVITRFGLSLDYCHFNDCIVAGVDGFVGLASVDVDEFDFAVFGTHEDNIGLDDGSNEGADHGIVLDDSLEEHGFDQSACSTHNLPHI